MQRMSGPRARHRRPGSRGLSWLFALVFALLLGILVAVPVSVLLASEADDGPMVRADSTPVPTRPDPAAAEAQRMLESLADATGRSAADYDRALFGQRWYDLDRNGCDTRNDILRRDLTDVVVKADTNGCKVLTGVLRDTYTGATIEFVSGVDTSVLVQVDHLVPLAWAWRHGAEHWTDDRRTAFANDPANLVATAGHVNQSKSDSGPGSWMPPDPAAHCDYAVSYITVLHDYGLGVGATDRQALVSTLSEC